MICCGRGGGRRCGQPWRSWLVSKVICHCVWIVERTKGSICCAEVSQTEYIMMMCMSNGFVLVSAEFHICLLLTLFLLENIEMSQNLEARWHCASVHAKCKARQGWSRIMGQVLRRHDRVPAVAVYVRFRKRHTFSPSSPCPCCSLLFCRPPPVEAPTCRCIRPVVVGESCGKTVSAEEREILRLRYTTLPPKSDVMCPPHE
ncbi:hypothetical protein GUJ93_ZPchr0012g19509 [Zizania palustris]|uniref:Uncharacterized protein n=1 Tax=Zizania palustris TaxID=103762 RepID=A0A8J5WK30_ZIZPA|nr:hypothetical protein GUJ93_ZPchr0012g19509 [Zizania palustris]